MSKILSLEVLTSSNRSTYKLGYVINNRKLFEIVLEERFLSGTPIVLYVGKDHKGDELFSVNAANPLVVVEYYK